MAEKWEQDGYYKQQGSIPFKWEIRPGVPKVIAQKPEQRKEQPKEEDHCHHKAFPETPIKLAPPPARIHLQLQMEPGTPSLLSAPKALSDRYGSYTSTLVQPVSVYPGGCLPFRPSPVKSKNGKKKINEHKNQLRVQPESEPEVLSDLNIGSQTPYEVESSSFHFGPHHLLRFPPTDHRPGRR